MWYGVEFGRELSSFVKHQGLCYRLDFEGEKFYTRLFSSKRLQT